MLASGDKSNTRTIMTLYALQHDDSALIGQVTLCDKFYNLIVSMVTPKQTSQNSTNYQLPDLIGVISFSVTQYKQCWGRYF